MVNCEKMSGYMNRFHTLRYLDDSEQVTLLDVPFDSDNPDLYTYSE